MRSESIGNPISNWSSLFIISVIVCVFVLPSSENDSGFIAQEQSVTSWNNGYLINLEMIGWLMKNIVRVVVSGLYFYLVFRFGY